MLEPTREHERKRERTMRLVPISSVSALVLVHVERRARTQTLWPARVRPSHHSPRRTRSHALARAPASRSHARIEITTYHYARSRTLTRVARALTAHPTRACHRPQRARRAAPARRISRRHAPRAHRARPRRAQLNDGHCRTLCALGVASRCAARARVATPTCDAHGCDGV